MIRFYQQWTAHHVANDIANELKTITWDISQQILPDDDSDSDKRILSVELENLDKFASWLAKYKDEVEVLEPEELKIKLLNKSSEVNINAC